MMEQDKFRFQLGDEEPEPPAIDEALQRRVHKLSQRMSFLTLMLPCLIALVLYVAYRDISLRVAQTQHSELQSVDRLAADLQLKTDALLARVSELEATVGAKLDDASKSVFALQEGIKKTEAAVERQNTDKADKKELQDSAARVDAALAALSKDLQGHTREVQGLTKDLQALAPFREELGSASALRNDVASVSARLQKLENSLGKDLTGLAAYMERTKSELEKIKTGLNSLQDRKLDRDAVDLEILKAKRLYQIALDQEIGRIDKTLNTLQRRLEQVERAFGSKSSAPSLPPLTGGITEQPVE